MNIPLGTELNYDHGVAKDKLSREDGANEILTKLGKLLQNSKHT